MLHIWRQHSEQGSVGPTGFLRGCTAPCGLRSPGWRLAVVPWATSRCARQLPGVLRPRESPRPSRPAHASRFASAGEQRRETAFQRGAQSLCCRPSRLIRKDLINIHVWQECTCLVARERASEQIAVGCWPHAPPAVFSACYLREVREPSPSNTLKSATGIFKSLMISLLN